MNVFYFRLSIFHFRFFLAPSPLIRLTPGHWVSVIKREVRCYPGAIPVAVITIPHKTGNKLVHFATVARFAPWEGHQVGVEPEDLPHEVLINELSGEKPEMQTSAAGEVFISIHITSGYSLFTFKINK